MALATLRSRITRTIRELKVLSDMATPLLDRIRADPSRILEYAGMAPDPWQTRLLQSPSPRTLLLCSRQSGKSTVAAALAMREAILHPRSLVLLLSPTLRQSCELFSDKVLRIYGDLGQPVAPVQSSALRLELANGSRIVSLPGDEKSIRGYSGVRLLVVDEASRVDDSLYYSIRPMLAVSQGRLIALTTPFGKRGWFFEEWHSGDHWQKVHITADQCSRISPAFLAEEEKALGPRWYRQEYFCSFEDVIDAVFNFEDISAACSGNDVEPLIVGGRP